MFTERLAFWIVVVWSAATNVLTASGIVNVPILAVFLGHRLVQFRDREFQYRPTLPTHALLHVFCAVLYGLIYPSFYFLAVRTRSALGEWQLGEGTNTRWTIAIGAVCMTWLASRLFDGLLTWTPLRFGPLVVDRSVALLGLGLCLWFHARTIPALLWAPVTGNTFPPVFLFRVFIPQVCFLGSTLVYGLAFFESMRPAPELWTAARARLAMPLAAAVMLVLFSPFWLSIPGVTHDEAIIKLRRNQSRIAEISKDAGLDPRLLAGIIYVAQTRDHPRLTGELIERLGGELDRSHYGTEFWEPLDLLNPSCGLCQIRITTAYQTRVLHARIQANAGLSAPLPYHALGVTPESLLPGVQTIAPRMSDSFIARFFSVTYFPAARNEVDPIPDSESLSASEDYNLTIATAMLVLLRDQWFSQGFSIDDRPEILATLYNLGYERSRPHADPRPNDFGRRVKAFMESERALELFPRDVKGEPE